MLRFSGGLLAKELSGILNWMLDGVDSLRQQKKFTETTEQKDALLEYREENSSVEGFIGECLTFGEGKTVNGRELYTEYKEYCGKDGRKFKGMIAFIKEMKSHAKRYGKMQYIERLNGHTPSRFEGVEVDRSWSEQSSFTKNRLDKEF